MRPHIYCHCLFVNGHGLVDEWLEFIDGAARGMLRKRLGRKRITIAMTKQFTVPFEGEITTRRKFEFVNSVLSGIRFDACFDSEFGTTTASLLVRPGEVDPHATWERIPDSHPLIQPSIPDNN